MNTVSSIILAAILAILGELVLHWFPWRLVFGRDLPRVEAYILGVLAFAVPLSWLLAAWQDLQALIALWIVIVAAGAAVCMAYGLDRALIRLVQYREMKQLLEHHDRTRQVNKGR